MVCQLPLITLLPDVLENNGTFDSIDFMKCFKIIVWRGVKKKNVSLKKKIIKK